MPPKYKQNLTYNFSYNVNYQSFVLYFVTFNKQKKRDMKIKILSFPSMDGD